jgi:hypothetical protein
MAEEHKEDVEEELDSDEEGYDTSVFDRALANAGEIRSRRISDGTRKSYTKKVNQWTSWLSQHHPVAMDPQNPGTLKLPLPPKAIEAYLGGNCLRFCKRVNRMVLKVPDTMFGYYSAMKFWYEENGVEWNGTDAVKEFLRGYKTMVTPHAFVLKLNY